MTTLNTFNTGLVSLGLLSISCVMPGVNHLEKMVVGVSIAERGSMEQKRERRDSDTKTVSSSAETVTTGLGTLVREKLVNSDSLSELQYVSVGPPIRVPLR